MKDRVIFVLDSRLTFSEAPASRFIYIAKSLKEKGFEVEVVGGKGERIAGLKTHQLGGSRHLSRLKILLFTYAETLSHSCNTIIARGYLAFFLLPLKIFGTRIILDFHGWLYREIRFFFGKSKYNKLKIFLYYVVERVGARYSSTMICVSKGVKDSLGQEEKAKSIILENGVDINESKIAAQEAETEKEKIYSEYHIPKEKTFIGFLGNWERRLDMETLFEGSKAAGVCLVVIGEGPRLNEFRNRWNNVVFPGKLPRFEALKIISLCAAAVAPYRKAYTFTSFWSQRKVKDYLSLGRPILMADVREREAYLAPNKNVLLYQPGNPQDLANKMNSIISDKILAEEMRQNNLKLAQQFDWQILVDKSGLAGKIRNQKPQKPHFRPRHFSDTTSQEESSQK
ncbi:MAG: glycosyltransferase [Candidatus Bathyarchaeia archaeon]